MTPEEKEQLEDIASFIKESIADDQMFGYVLANVGHDVGGMLGLYDGFSPRTAGAHAREVKQVMSNPTYNNDIVIIRNATLQEAACFVSDATDRLKTIATRMAKKEPAIGKLFEAIEPGLRTIGSSISNDDMVIIEEVKPPETT